MDYRSQIKEKMGKLLFLEMNIKGFKESIGIPEYVEFKNKDLYLPISTEYISSNIENEIKIKNLPIYYFIEGMFIAFGCDENLRFILENLKMKKSVLNAYSKEKVYLLNINDIYSIYAENKKVYARTKDKKYIVNHRLYELEEILDGNKFVRISNSAIINIYKIENLEASINGMITINFKNGEKEYISRRYLKKVKKILDI